MTLISTRVVCWSAVFAAAAAQSIATFATVEAGCTAAQMAYDSGTDSLLIMCRPADSSDGHVLSYPAHGAAATTLVSAITRPEIPIVVSVSRREGYVATEDSPRHIFKFDLDAAAPAALTSILSGYVVKAMALRSAIALTT